MGRLHRLPHFDYSQAGYYFLTFCAKERNCILSSILSPSAGRGILDAPTLQLTACGLQVESALHFLDEHLPYLTIDSYVIMPNHVHMIVQITQSFEEGASGKPRPTKMDCPADAYIPKLISSLKRYTNRSCGSDLWQDGYHDHIIRNEADYLRIWTYMDQNPVKWREDCYYEEGIL